MTEKERKKEHRYLNNIILDLETCMRNLSTDMTVAATNQAAAARARKLTSELTLLGKSFRKHSVNVHRK